MSILSILEKIEDGKEYFYIQKGLSQKAANAIGIKMCKKDHRGMTYNPTTGLIIYT
jgi:hypothetical protein